MTIQRVLNYLGLGALALMFALSGGRLAVRALTQAAEADRVTVIRFAHWQLEAGMREAFADAVAAYEALNPGVRVEQLVVPERAYGAWMTTQLVGGMAPDIIQYRYSDPALLARYFSPLGQAIAQPNPYNRGSALEGMPWRETFTDSLTNPLSLCEPLEEVYGIPFATVTVRMFYNIPLYQRLTGRTEPPATFEEFLATAEIIRAQSAREGRQIHPIAGSMFTANILVTHIFNTQMQAHAATPQGPPGMSYRGPDQLIALLRGDLQPRSEPMRSGFRVMEAAINTLPPGFAQSMREDATFQFAQQRVVMIAAGSFDEASLRSESAFEIGVFPLPMPTPGAGEFGHLTLGPLAESASKVAGVFGVTRRSPNQDQAIDFLRFLSSYEGASSFAQLSRWPPVVRGVRMPEEIQVFAPMLEGYPAAFDLRALEHFPDTQRVVLQHSLTRLQGPTGGLENYLNRLEEALPRTIRSDLERIQRRRSQTISWMDTTTAAMRRNDEEQAAALACTAFSMERERAWLAVELARADANR
jgi:raffinose/stachyose/melibiose transport system substrate-binding protein